MSQLEATRQGAEYIDDLATVARAHTMLVGRIVIGHGDWRAEHGRCDAVKSVAKLQSEH